jgi:hypothetical protein
MRSRSSFSTSNSMTRINASRAGSPGNADNDLFAETIDSLDLKVTIFATFLLNFRRFVDNRIDFYGKTL